MIVAINREFQWQLRFFDSAWNMTPQQRIPVSVTFDGGMPWTGAATAESSNVAAIAMSANPALVNAFRAGINMIVEAAGQRFAFNLGGTSRMVVDLTHCVQSELAIERGDPPPVFPTGFATSSPKKLTPPAPPSHEAQAELELAATRIATNLLLQAKLPNAHLLSREDTPDAIKNLGVAWKSDAGMGAVELLAPSAANNPQQVVAQLIDSDAAVCKGDFASGRSSELVDNTIVTKAFTGCKDSNGTRAYRYFILHNEGSAYIVYALAGASGSADQVSNAPKMTDADFQTAAVKAAFTR